MKSRFFGIFAAVLFSSAASAAFAQTAPTPAPTAAPAAQIPSLPSSTSPLIQAAINAVAGRVKADLGWDANHVRGEVTYFKRFDMQVRTAQGSYRQIHLHQGTVINPRGTSLQTGNRVDVQGTANSDGSINANQITLQ